MSKRLGGIIGWKYKTSSWHLNRFPDGSNIGSVNSIIPGGHKKNTDLRRNCSRLSKHCTKPAFEDEMCSKVGLIFNFQTRGLETYGQYSTDLRLIFVYCFRSLAQPIIAGHI